MLIRKNADAGSGAGRIDASGPAVATVGKIFWLAIAGNQVLTANDDGSAAKTLVSGQGVSAPDGVGVDLAGKWNHGAQDTLSLIVHPDIAREWARDLLAAADAAEADERKVRRG